MCPRGSRPGPTGHCTCSEGVVIAGACVPPKIADTYCGKGARYEHGACTPVACPGKRPRDETTGVCVSGAVWRELGRDVSQGEERAERGLGCEDDDDVLLVDQGHVRCVARSSGCGRDAQWVDGGCAPRKLGCPPGSVADGEACTAFLRPGVDKEGAVVDVGLWVRLTLGADRAQGSPGICGVIARRPWLFAGMQGAVPSAFRAQITFVFPDNDVTRVHVRVAVTEEGRRPVPQAATLLLEQWASPLVEVVRSLGGTSSAASVTTNLGCRLLETHDPVPAPDAEEKPPRAEAEGKPHAHG